MSTAKKTKIVEDVDPQEEGEENVQMENNEEDETSKKHHITHVIRENATRPITRVQVLTLGKKDDLGEEKERDLILTVGGDQANLYEGKHLDLASHFVNSPNEHCPTAGE